MNAWTRYVVAPLGDDVERLHAESARLVALPERKGIAWQELRPLPPTDCSALTSAKAWMSEWMAGAFYGYEQAIEASRDV